MPYSILDQSLPHGVKLGSFVIRELVGANRQAYTYLAYDRSLDREVIVKENFPISLASRSKETNVVLPKSPEATEAYENRKNRFLEEGQKMAALECPGVPMTYGVYEALGTAYVVTSKIHGFSLEEELERRYIRNEPWEPVEIKNMLTELLETLAYLHKKNIYHQDIRPSHIWMTKASQPVLIGFDFPEPETTESKKAFQTSTECISPEKLLYREIDEIRADLYSLGAIFHKLILGNYPRRGDIRFHSGEKNKRLSDNKLLLSKYHRSFLEGIDKALEPKKDLRFAQAGEWLDYLKTAKTTALEETEEAPKRNISIETKLILGESESGEGDDSSGKSGRRKGKGFFRRLFSSSEDEETSD